MNEMIEVLKMGDYGAYVWSAYGVFAIIMIVNVVAAKRRKQQLKKQLRAMQ